MGLTDLSDPLISRSQVREMFLGDLLLTGMKYIILLYFILWRQDACFIICIFRIGQEMVFWSSSAKKFLTFKKIILCSEVG